MPKRKSVKKGKFKSSKKGFLVLLSAALFIFILIVLIFSSRTKITTENANNLERTQVMSAINKKREENGIPKLTESKLLNYSATIRAADMAGKKYISHTTPEGKRFQEIIKETGYDCDGCEISWAENLGSNYYSVEELIEAWTDSIAHKAIMLDPELKDVGIGIAYDTDGKSYIVMHAGVKN